MNEGRGLLRGGILAAAVLAVVVAAVFGWRVMVDSDPSGAAAAPTPPATTSVGKAAGNSPYPELESEAEPGTDPSPPADPTDDPAHQPVRALYLGDSIALENHTVLADLLKESGTATLHSAPHSGTTLCDYMEGKTGDSLLVPRHHTAAALVRAQRPQVVLLQFWGNSWIYTPCMGKILAPQRAYYERYAADARALTTEIERAAADVGIERPTLVWVLQGPDPMAPDRIRRVNDIYKAQAESTGDRTADAGAAVSPAGDRYTWVQQLPCNAYERAHPEYCTKGTTTELHHDNDYLHFCLEPMTKNPKPCTKRSPGVMRYSQAIAAAVAHHARGTQQD
ncbi:SGNH/GDSL hydrolase family protein [Streptomyces sp. NPDC057806]|uniref:SGNH/GDSL hydrolase family protein n=1 Tax=Streptomyces sp. NPDC057806 TaxID=3346255 RepID=UPI00367DA248